MKGAIVVFGAVVAALIFAPQVRAKLRTAYAKDIRPLWGMVATPWADSRFASTRSTGADIQNTLGVRFKLAWPGTQTNLSRKEEFQGGFSQVIQ